MRRFIDFITVRDRGLAYAVAEALERDGEYSVDYCEEPDAKDPHGSHVDLRIFRNEKLTPPPVGFSGEDKTNDSN